MRRRFAAVFYIRHIHHAFTIIFETRHTGLIMASLNVLVKLLPSLPFRLSPCFFIGVHRFLSTSCFYFHLLNFLGYTRGTYLILQPRFYRLPRVRHSIRSHTFSGSVFSVLCPFCLQYFFSCLSLLLLYLFLMLSLLLFSCIRSRDFSLTRESNSLSHYWRVRLLSLEPRLFLYCPHNTTLSFRLQFPSFSISFLWIQWVVHSLASVFSPTSLSGSSGIAVSSSWAPNVNFWKTSVRKTIWDLEFSEHKL